VSKQHKKLYNQRRRYKETFFELPWHRRLGKKIEEYNKRLTVTLLGKLLRIRSVAAPLNPKEIKSILIIRNDAIGDMVLSTPLIRAITHYFPWIKIGVAGSFRNLSVLEHDPDVDARYDCSEGSTSQMRLGAKQARKEKWDLVIPLVYNRKTKMAILSRLISPKGITSMIIMPNDPPARYQKLFSLIVRSEYDTGEIQMIDLIRLHFEKIFGLHIPDEYWLPSLYHAPEALERIKKYTDDLLTKTRTSRYIHINLEAKTPHKEYGLEKSYVLSNEILRQHPDTIVIWTCSPVAASTVEAFLMDKHEERIHFVKTNNIHELIALVRFSSLVITPDTSVVHIASAEKKPIIALFPRLNEWLPYGVPNRVFTPVLGEPVATIPIADCIDSVKNLLS